MGKIGLTRDSRSLQEKSMVEPCTTIGANATLGSFKFRGFLNRPNPFSLSNIDLHICSNWGLTALPPRGGPWKLGSGLGQNPEANTALGVGRGCARLRALFESLGLDGLRSPPSLYPHPLSPPSPPVQQHRAVLGRTWKRSRVRRRPRQEVE